MIEIIKRDILRALKIDLEWAKMMASSKSSDKRLCVEGLVSSCRDRLHGYRFILQMPRNECDVYIILIDEIEDIIRNNPVDSSSNLISSKRSIIL